MTIAKKKLEISRAWPLRQRRSRCPVACTLDILGDRWSLLVMRDLFLGRSRFKEFAASPEGIPTNILSERLERLVHHGIITATPVTQGSSRVAYHLTRKGEALRPVLRRMRDWGLKWEPGTSMGMAQRRG
ncbi:MAG TPA: helix-turn-helix domain-containing protein [Candidatus Methylacidiphilales bacterium]|nr:helix-turn-helix domain-containing protein [Candidatus Methylacidiphilales bacterium]